MSGCIFLLIILALNNNNKLEYSNFIIIISCGCINITSAWSSHHKIQYSIKRNRERVKNIINLFRLIDKKREKQVKILCKHNFFVISLELKADQILLVFRIISVHVIECLCWSWSTNDYIFDRRRFFLHFIFSLILFISIEYHCFIFLNVNIILSRSFHFGHNWLLYWHFIWICPTFSCLPMYAMHEENKPNSIKIRIMLENWLNNFFVVFKSKLPFGAKFELNRTLSRYSR